MEQLKQFAKTLGATFFTKEENGDEIASVAIIPLPKPHTAFFGFYHFDPNKKEIAKQNMEQAITFAKEQGIKHLVGPIDVNTWFSYRLKIDHNGNEKDYWWEPHNPPQYVELLKELGMKEHMSYSTVATGDIEKMLEKTKHATLRTENEGYSFRLIDMDNLEKEIEALYNVSIIGFKDNYLFSPIDLETFKKLYTAGKTQIDFSYSCFAIDNEGKEVAFFFVFEQDDYIVMKSTAVLPEHRGRGLSNAVLYPAFQRALQENKRGYISALMIDGAQSTSYSKHGNFLWSHRYALFELDL
jgi:predicted GNAT family acetyltransferase